MGFWRKLILCKIFFLISLTPAAAADRDQITAQIKTFIQGQLEIPSAEVNVVVKTPVERLELCPEPQLSLPSRKKIWGTLSIRAMCGTQRHFLQANVQVTAPYLVATRPIPPKQKIQAEDVALQQGRLDALSVPPLADPALAVGAVSIRMIGAGQPIAASMLRNPWAVKMGETVKVTVSGDGFSIVSEGKAMDNAAINSAVRIRMESGQIITGIVAETGLVKIVQ
ncbi:flagellar basal body P-ring formation chaperone FlgA [Lonsdalea britannica]|uniref:flagellar basal body P-ring formation chaperone FlgA n=1 Tax=Lonsdalea britannica TaxID=1082704 RepID=UPI0026F275EC|nr:flagellar basal body P-ring formation chaperone FlgA [Lonsdalea britannica]